MECEVQGEGGGRQVRWGGRGDIGGIVAIVAIVAIEGERNTSELRANYEQNTSKL